MSTKLSTFLASALILILPVLSLEIIRKEGAALPFNCYTSEGQACAFPFVHQGKEMNECVQNNEVDSIGFNCPIKLNAETREAEQWGKCQLDSCVYACSTVAGSRCVFPFKFDAAGPVQGRCAKNAGNGNFQCATKVDANTGVGQDFGDCQQESCPLD